MKKGANLKIILDGKFTRKLVFSIFAGLAFFPASAIFAQTVETAPKPVPPPSRIWRTTKRIQNESEIPAEKFIATDAKVNISLCVTSGNVKINGWERGEIRALIDGGSDVGFSVRDKNRETGKPNWVMVLAFDPSKNREAGLDECLSGEEIELDVPRGATINLKSHEGEIMIASVNKVSVVNDGGNISLDDIGQGIDARNFEGDITVGKSSGAMTLTSTNGNILVYETTGGEVGDSLRVKTSSGAITLRQAAQKQIEASSNTGSIRFDGTFASGGQYSFGATSGAISLVIPAASSFKIEAFYGGAFQSDISLKELTRDINPPVQKMTAIFGGGDANLSLRNISGAISIRKK